MYGTDLGQATNWIIFRTALSFSCTALCSSGIFFIYILRVCTLYSYILRIFFIYTKFDICMCQPRYYNIVVSIRLAVERVTSMQKLHISIHGNMYTYHSRYSVQLCAGNVTEVVE